MTASIFVPGQVSLRLFYVILHALVLGEVLFFRSDRVQICIRRVPSRDPGSHVHACVSDIITVRPFKWLDRVNPEGRPGESWKCLQW